MKIREGAYYRTRDGFVAGPMRSTKDQSWYSNHHTWNEDGRSFSSGGSFFCSSLDLISKVYVSDTPPADATAPETKTLRDEFAMRLMDRDAFMVGYKEEAEQLYRAADAMMEARKK